MAAEGDPAAFLASVPIDAKPTQRLARKLAAFESHRKDHDDAVAAWEEGFFSPNLKLPATLYRLEARRGSTARWLTLQRLRFLDIRFGRPVPPVRFETVTPEAMEQAYGADPAEPWRIYMPPEAIPNIEVSRRVPPMSARITGSASARPRASATSPGRACTSRSRRSRPPTCLRQRRFIEFDHYGRRPATCRSVQIRIRVIELELPVAWPAPHSGFYGGEPFFAGRRLGPSTFSAQARSSRSRCIGAAAGDAPVAIGGASMGALAALLAASYSPHWPQSMRPDAVALLTVSDQIDSLVAEARSPPGSAWPRRSNARAGRPST